MPFAAASSMNYKSRKEQCEGHPQSILFKELFALSVSSQIFTVYCTLMFVAIPTKKMAYELGICLQIQMYSIVPAL
jgi:hypothetical protein